MAVGSQQSRQLRKLRKTVREQIDASSVNAVAFKVGVSRESLARFAAGLPVQAGTVEMLKQAISRAQEAL